MHQNTSNTTRRTCTDSRDSFCRRGFCSTGTIWWPLEITWVLFEILGNKAFVMFCISWNSCIKQKLHCPSVYHPTDPTEKFRYFPRLSAVSARRQKCSNQCVFPAGGCDSWCRNVDTVTSTLLFLIINIRAFMKKMQLSTPSTSYPLFIQLSS